MFDWLADPNAWIALATLTALEIVLGVDNIIFISILVGRLPEDQQEKAADIFMKIFNGSLWELWQLAREKEGLPPVAMDEKQARFLQLAANAISDAFFYEAPVLLQLQSFDQVKASVFQVTRSPGKNVVYLGCLLLVLGVLLFGHKKNAYWYGSTLNIEQARKLKQLELENGRLKKLVAGLSLEKQVLKDIAEGNL